MYVKITMEGKNLTCLTFFYHLQLGLYSDLYMLQTVVDEDRKYKFCFIYKTIKTHLEELKIP
jgi:hypothetical protein